MEFNNIINSLTYIGPEAAISLFLLLIVLVDLIMGKNKRILPIVAITGVIVTAVFVLYQLSFSGFGFAEMSKTIKYGMITVDAFGVFFKIIVLLSTLLVIFFSYSSDEVKKSHERLGEYYTLIFGMVLGMLLMISASDLILIYLSMELMSLSSYVLSGFTKLKARNSEAALKYVIYGAVSSGIMLFGISLFYGMI